MSNAPSRKYESYVDGAQQALLGFERVTGTSDEKGETLLSVTVRLPRGEGDEYLLIARFECDGKRMVAFRSAEFMVELFVGFVRAMKHGNLKYKEDKYGNGND